MTEIRAIFGLGNPGAQYHNTRHNAGFRFVDALAAEYQAELNLSVRFTSDIGRMNFDGQRIWLVKPKSFMNTSGIVVRSFTHYYKFDSSSLIVVHDDLDLPLGSARIKRSGGHGGHNGLRDILKHIGTRDFLRIRIGIGRPAVGQSTTPFVLGTPNRHDQSLIENSIDDAAAVLPDILSGQIETAMNKLHSP